MEKNGKGRGKDPDLGLLQACGCGLSPRSSLPGLPITLRRWGFALIRGIGPERGNTQPSRTAKGSGPVHFPRSRHDLLLHVCPPRALAGYSAEPCMRSRSRGTLELLFLDFRYFRRASSVTCHQGSMCRAGGPRYHPRWAARPRCLPGGRAAWYTYKGVPAVGILSGLSWPMHSM